MIATRDISGNVPEPVLAVPTYSARRFLQYTVILYVDYEYNVRLFIGLRDLGLGAGSGVATQANAFPY